MTKRKPYTQYTDHAIIRYFKNPSADLSKWNRAERLNWKAVDEAFSQFTPKEQAMIGILYSHGTLRYNIVKMSKERRIDTDSLWRMIEVFRKKVAKYRGLI